MNFRAVGKDVEFGVPFRPHHAGRFEFRARVRNYAVLSPLHFHHCHPARFGFREP